jgi:hypothetical protein
MGAIAGRKLWPWADLKYDMVLLSSLLGYSTTQNSRVVYNTYESILFLAQTLALIKMKEYFAVLKVHLRMVYRTLNVYVAVS